jgi:hypothetical protein
MRKFVLFAAVSVVLSIVATFVVRSLLGRGDSKQLDA